VVLYYLEDGTLQVGEPREDNSGCDQGTFLRRHVIPGVDGRPVTYRDLVVS
jgi:hypothetical protein